MCLKFGFMIDTSSYCIIENSFSIFYSRRISPKRIKNLCAHLRDTVPRQHSYLRKCWCGGELFAKLAGPESEYQISRTRGMRVNRSNIEEIKN